MSFYFHDQIRKSVKRVITILENVIICRYLCALSSYFVKQKLHLKVVFTKVAMKNKIATRYNTSEYLQSDSIVD